MIGWISGHMEFVLAGLMFAEKIVLISKSKHQDIIIAGLKGLVGLFKNRK